MKHRPILLLALLSATSACSSETPAPIESYRVVKTYDHDPRAYCQGLLFHAGKFYESSGQWGLSNVRRADLASGRVELQKDLPSNYFAEGLALHDGELFQLTWKAGIVRVLDLETLEVKRTHRYTGEGWGITSNGEHLITSDGTDVLTFRDPATFEAVRTIKVSAADTVIPTLNELEWIEGEIWANVWKREYLVRIDPKTGSLTGWIDLTGLFDANSIANPDSVLNGIAYDPEGKRIFVTGKLWPWLFEIEVVPAAQ